MNTDNPLSHKSNQPHRLTSAQIALLEEVRARPRRVVQTYVPAAKLKALGLVSLSDNPPSGLIVTITDAGRAVLADREQR